MGFIQDLRARVQRKTSNIYDTLFTRRVSIYVTAACFTFGVSANMISALNCLVGLAACALIGFGDGWLVLGGIALVHVFAVLDSVDGELARLREKYTIVGLFLEDLAAFTMINGMFLAVGAYLHRTSGRLWPLLVAVVLVAFGRNAMQVARRAMFKSVRTARPIDPAVVAAHAALPKQPSSAIRTLGERLLHYTNVWLVLTSAILVEQLTEISIVAYAFALYATAVLLKEAAVIATYSFTNALEHELLDLYHRARSLPTDPVSGDTLAGD
ncbi:MAG: CDP-alcohol phosphatidyltransferase family protein [Kofleriaceae bacterium]